MLIKQTVKIRWNSRYKKHYENLGYKYTKMNEYFEVDAEHLTRRSSVRVSFICDYCGITGEKRNDSLMENREIVNKDCCSDRSCMAKKNWEIAFLNKSNKEGTLATNFPELTQQWGVKNKKKPHEYLAGSNEKVWWECKENHEWEAEIYRRTSKGSGCPYCAGQRATDDNNIEALGLEIVNQWSNKNKTSPKEYMPGSNKRVLWVCEKSHEWETTVYNRAIGGTGCPVCNESKGEKVIREWLNTNEISFVPQYETKDLVGVGGKPLKFDFAIINTEKDVKLLIEYDGEFHFAKQYEDDNFETLKIHDKYKDKYCKSKNIKLLRIPYYEFKSISDILHKNIIKKQAS